MGTEIIFQIVFLPIGLSAGYLAGLITKGRRPIGLLGDMLLGMIGAYLGVWLPAAFGVIIPGAFAGASVATLIGAVVVLFIVRRIRKA
ncbi:GlsB/YeaQ/YmgE family stress response membrane protein [Hyphobacterium sp. HN65]|uniref:GlsB/YeaQ/YmgE family stress response membrane protein n=1 Tax=Hyphobacterium lacteum TaxID=3116575 RepID=A0ABU7LTI5_9PROT|nr:GlsB/YeaQ/YmgE family stress response membrane protein [Hyphobacterium sp. HN65]MEE2527203.1 GlsB/YeaQ/YmgE family stress response membrane protein [Hyphobacterium sp. HN65]